MDIHGRPCALEDVHKCATKTAKTKASASGLVKNVKKFYSYLNADRLLQIPIPRQPVQFDVNMLAKISPGEVDSDVLAAEFEVFANILSSGKLTQSGGVDIEEKVIKFVYKNQYALSQSWKSYKLMITAPITVAKDERTFSHIKFVKRFYRSTMADKRLDHLMILNFEMDLTDLLDMTHVMWASRPRC